MSSQRRNPALGLGMALCLACAGLGLIWLADRFLPDAHHAIGLSLVGGLLVVLLLRADRRLWPLLSGAALVGSFAAFLALKTPPWLAIVQSGTLAVVGLATAHALRKILDAGDGLTSRRFVAALLLIAPVGAFVSTLMTALSYGTVTDPDWISDVGQDFLSHLLCLLLIVPTLMAIGAEDRQQGAREYLEPAALAITGAALSALVFWQTRQPALFTLVPIVVLAAFRLRVVDALAVVWAISFTAVAVTFSGLGMIGTSSAGTLERLNMLQLFIVIQIFLVLAIRAIIGERDRLGDVAAESDRLFRRIAEATPVGFIHLDESGNPTFVNRRWTEISGQTPDKVVNGRWVDVVAAIDRPAVRSLWAQARAVQGPASAEFAYCRSDGSPGWLHLGITPAIDEHTLLGFVIQISDVTARRSAERLLHERERLYRLVTENSQDAILRVALDGRIVFASSAFQRHFGMLPQEADSMDLRQLIDAEDRHIVDHLLDSDGNSINEPHVQFRLRPRPDLPVNWVEVSHRHLFDELTGKPVELVLSLRNISRRRMLEEEQARTTAKLHESNRLLRMAEELAQVGHWRFDLAHLALQSSDSALRIWGCDDLEQIDVATAFARLDQENRGKILRLAAAARDSGLQQDAMIELTMADGSVRYVRFGVQVDLDKDGQVAGLFGIVRDKTANVQAEKALIEARDAAQAAARAKGQFLATMSHEIRTPMTGVLGMIDLLDEEQAPDDHALYMATLKQSATLLMTVLDDVLDFSRIDSGALRLDRMTFNIDELVRTTVNLYANGASRKGVLLQYQSRLTGPPLVSADSARLQQIVCNLVANAVKFTSQGCITVTLEEGLARADGREWRIRVADSGIGMTEDDLERLFQPFFQTESSRAGNFGGTGLGLAICQRIAAAMGGRVSATAALGKGATFIVDLPLKDTTDAPSTPASPASSGPESSSALRLLVADDNPVNRMLIVAMLSRMGHQTVVVENGRQAVEKADSGDFDAILMDMHMPEMDGLAATRTIRSGGGRCAHVPIVALTADASPERRRFYEGGGLSAFIAKPIDQAALALLLEGYAANGQDGAPGTPERAARMI